jgi:glycosyltransferase involved in cell wall biosynthesis
MRILHVVTLFSPDGAYGGPVRVAMNQSSALRGRGHEVVVAAAATGYSTLPTELDGVPLHLFPMATAIPGIGFAGIYARGLSAWLRAHASEFEVVHVHLARDFVTLPAARTALASGLPIVAQPHGMIVPSGKLLARPLDRFATVPALRAARSVFHLTAREATELTAVAGAGLALRELPNGVPEAPPAGSAGTSALDDTASHDANSGDVPEVLFLARLHPRKRPDMFVRMAAMLLAEGIEARFTLVGPDEGAAEATEAAIVAAGVGDRIRYTGPVPADQALARIARAAVYVLPSIDEPFPMSVLEAMSLGLPVVVTDSCGLAGLISESGSGAVAGADLGSLTAAVRDLLTDLTRAQAMGAAGRTVVRSHLTMDAVAERLEAAYTEAVRTGVGAA